MSTGHVLLIESNPALARTYGAYLIEAGYQATIAQSIEQANHRAKRPGIGLILLDPDELDLTMSPPDYIRALPDRPVILVTEQASMTMVIESMKAGAKDVFIKPFDRKRFVKSVDHFYPADESKKSPLPPKKKPEKPAFIGSSQVAENLRQEIDTIARSQAPVFITGESGTGKEVSARLVHYMGPRRHQPFVPVNCAAIPENLIESELFGHAKGAFTGAIQDRQGAIQRADGGVLFLDEVLDMPAIAQTKLLRFLEDQKVCPVGNDNEIQVDVRIISASNKDPRREVMSGHFREDLFYRLHVIALHLPPLRDRTADIPELTQHFLSVLASKEDRSTPHLDPNAMNALIQHPWPGNIRELKNTLHHALTITQSRVIDRDTIIRAMPPETSEPMALNQPQPLANVERRAIRRAIDHCNGNIRKAAELLEISPSTIYRKKESW
jgi:two-component system repressor protein LuxO